MERVSASRKDSENVALFVVIDADAAGVAAAGTLRLKERRQVRPFRDWC